jgi:predicted O-linked N-acetylglucosamine transferase (SPINDLY family)
MSDGTATQTFHQAVDRHRAGRLDEAERLYRRTLAENPSHADALFLLGGIELNSGRAVAAVDSFSRATALAPENAAYHANLGEAYRRVGQLDHAMNAFMRAMAIRPDMAEPVFNLGILLEEGGAIDGAIACYEQAAQLRPDLAPVRDRLAAARKRTSAVTKPALAGYKADGAVLMLLAFANRLVGLGATERAVMLLRRAVEMQPYVAECHNSLGAALLKDDRADEAIASFRRSLELTPGQADVLGNLGVALSCNGRVSEAVDTIREALKVAPGPFGHSCLLFTVAFDPRATARSILAEAQAFDRAHAHRLLDEAREPHVNDRDPERRLRIGYVSPDFRGHCQSLFTVPLLSHHDHGSFEIFCYSDVSTPTDITQRLAGYADHWRNLAGVEDDEAARRIRADRIDILVDLTMHMADNHALVFARKPAPVQVCWLAYPGTTGLAAIDYRISDPYLDPAGCDESVYSEATMRLPDTFWCYDPLTTGPDVGPLPARSQGHVTFGCLNNFTKVNPGVLDLWGRVLAAVPGSCLVVMAPPGDARNRVTAGLAKHGVGAERIEFAPRRLRDDYLASYNGIDICLDTVPYNGHTTSLDAFWMGVPVVTLVGETIVGRAGLCQAQNLGLPELVATTSDDYVRIAASLAGDLDRLAELRAGLRERIVKSPLMDGSRFTRNLEAAYREMWRRWCAAVAGRPEAQRPPSTTTQL